MLPVDTESLLCFTKFLADTSCFRLLQLLLLCSSLLFSWQERWAFSSVWNWAAASALLHSVCQSFCSPLDSQLSGWWEYLLLCKNTSTFCIIAAFNITKHTAFSYIITYASANSSGFKEASKQLGNCFKQSKWCYSVLNCCFHSEQALPLHIIYHCIQIKLLEFRI